MVYIFTTCGFTYFEYVNGGLSPPHQRRHYHRAHSLQKYAAWQLEENSCPLVLVLLVVVVVVLLLQLLLLAFLWHKVYVHLRGGLKMDVHSWSWWRPLHTNVQLACDV
ncbi:hypothetical protein E2C01_028163 [Portunus trituberculatus]|uniref:Uncharacterized protein n=1 Tax=Portunus trituberculatus TaxID=210409 RepID=A0A5B7EKM1_PORTR|nr:hypothetical protein [Portunus trituberculatus]